jgi:hypothetical protein
MKSRCLEHPRARIFGRLAIISEALFGPELAPEPASEIGIEPLSAARRWTARCRSGMVCDIPIIQMEFQACR